MRLATRILLLTVVLLSHSFRIYSQTADARVCTGTRSVFAADGMAGSTYEYILEEPNAGVLTVLHVDTVMVHWGSTHGFYRLGVRETSRAGCISDWVYLSVELTGEGAVFTEPQYFICGSGGVTVDFNKGAFRSYQWIDPAVQAANGHISIPGRYELQTVDFDNCVVSSFIDVVGLPLLQVSLGADTVICTPSFTLRAEGASSNPSDTYYTWSTGESGAMLHQISVFNHDTRKDAEYWVHAELNGCSTSDTIMVLACLDPPENIFVPNTFTPNDDGDNDVWNIHDLIHYPDCIVEVYDRWARRVFQSTRGYTVPWDGRDSRGQYLPVETYYYIINLNNGSLPVSGNISIIR